MQLPEPNDDENDMLDLAFGLTETCATLQRMMALSESSSSRNLCHDVSGHPLHN